jgi:hypothetical protein
MKRLPLATAFIVFVLDGCAEHKYVSQQKTIIDFPAYEDPDGYSVLAQLLAKKGESWQNSTIRISAVTTKESPDGIDSFEKCIKVPDEFKEVATNYLEMSKHSYVLQDRFGPGARFQIIDQPKVSQWDLKHTPRSPKVVEEKISDGIYFVSAVAFDTNKTHAIARINYVCGGLCGGGSYYLLAKSEDGWKEVQPKSFCVWMY